MRPEFTAVSAQRRHNRAEFVRPIHAAGICADSCKRGGRRNLFPVATDHRRFRIQKTEPFRRTAFVRAVRRRKKQIDFVKYDAAIPAVENSVR